LSFKINNDHVRYQRLTPVILATKEAEIRRIVVGSQPRQSFSKTLSQKNHHKIGLVEWLKVKSLSSNHKKKKKD
jgi:hypothetical protein